MTTQSARGADYTPTVSQYRSLASDEYLLAVLTSLLPVIISIFTRQKVRSYLPSRLRRIRGCSAPAKAISSFSSEGTEHSRPEGPRTPLCHPVTDR